MSKVFTVTQVNGSTVVNVNSGHQLSIINGKYFVDGVEVDINNVDELAKLDIQHANIIINGNVNEIRVDRLGSVTVQGDVKGNVETYNGDVRCNNIGGDARTYNGDITASKVVGSVKTHNGNIVG